MPESAPVAEAPFASGLEDFESFVRQHRPRIFRFLLASLRDKEAACSGGGSAPVRRHASARAEGDEGIRPVVRSGSETKGELPKIAPKSFVPPIRPQDDPKLAVNPTIVTPEMPNINSPNFGNPLAGVGIPSAGNGIGSGIGSGKGPGVGPGSGGSFGGGAFKIGGGVSAPVPVYRPEPEYSEEARKAKWQGAVLLELVVDTDGVPQDIRVIRSVGLGLDQKAIEAVRKWRFKPGQKDGKPVPVSANIEVNFRLL